MIIEPRIEAVFRHSPKHAAGLAQVVAGAPGTLEAAYAVGKFCHDKDIPDFPNPFDRDHKLFPVWKGGFFAGYSGMPMPAPVRPKKVEAVAEEPQKTEAPTPEKAPPVPEKPDLSRFETKKDLDEYAASVGITLDRRQTRKAMEAVFWTAYEAK